MYNNMQNKQMFHLSILKFGTLKFEAINSWEVQYTFRWQIKSVESPTRPLLLHCPPTLVVNQLWGLLISALPLCSKWCCWWLACCFAWVQLWLRAGCTIYPWGIWGKVAIWYVAVVAIFTACYCLRLWALHFACYLTPWLCTSDLLFTSWSAVAISWHFIASCLIWKHTPLYPHNTSPVSSAIPSASVPQTADTWVFHCQSWDNWHG